MTTTIAVELGPANQFKLSLIAFLDNLRHRNLTFPKIHNRSLFLLDSNPEKLAGEVNKINQAMMLTNADLNSPPVISMESKLFGKTGFFISIRREDLPLYEFTRNKYFSEIPTLRKIVV